MACRRQLSKKVGTSLSCRSSITSLTWPTDVFVLTNDTIDYYQFNGTDFILQAVECTVSPGGTTAVCNGTSIQIVSCPSKIRNLAYRPTLLLSQSDPANGGAVALAQADGVTFSGASSGVTAYAPTGTVDVAGVSFATAAPSIVESATAFLTTYLSSVGSSVSAQLASVDASLSSEFPDSSTGSGDTALPTEAPGANTGLAAGGFTFPSDIGFTMT